MEKNWAAFITRFRNYERECIEYINLLTTATPGTGITHTNKVYETDICNSLSCKKGWVRKILNPFYNCTKGCCCNVVWNGFKKKRKNVKK